MRRPEYANRLVRPLWSRLGAQEDQLLRHAHVAGAHRKAQLGRGGWRLRCLRHR